MGMMADRYVDWSLVDLNMQDKLMLMTDTVYNVRLITS